MFLHSDTRNYKIKRFSVIRQNGSEYYATDESGCMKHTIIKYSKEAILAAKNTFEEVENEIAIMRTINHPNIIKYVEDFEDDDNIYIVTEHFSDSTLVSKLEEMRIIEEEKIKKMFKQLFEAVAYLHRHGIVHGLLFPENILVNANWEIKLVNFSRAMAKTQIIDRENFFLPPPEILKGECNSSPLTEVFALGVLLYFTCSRTKPWDSPYDNELIRFIMNNKLVQATMISNQCFSLLKTMLEINPSKRASMNQVRMHFWVKSNETSKKLITQQSCIMSKRKSRRVSVNTDFNLRKSKIKYIEKTHRKSDNTRLVPCTSKENFDPNKETFVQESKPKKLGKMINLQKLGY